MSASSPVSLRLDDDVRAVLERDARAHGVGLATYLRNLATEQAKQLRKAAVREQSRALGERARSSTGVAEFYDDSGSSAPEVTANQQQIGESNRG